MGMNENLSVTKYIYMALIMFVYLKVHAMHEIMYMYYQPYQVLKLKKLNIKHVAWVTTFIGGMSQICPSDNRM